MCVILGITSLFYLDVNQVVGARTTWVVTVILRASVRGWSRRDGMTCLGPPRIKWQPGARTKVSCHALVSPPTPPRCALPLTALLPSGLTFV